MDSLQPGQQFGPYRIVSQIGEGGMAAVYKAYQPTMDRHVAIKVLPAQFVKNKEFMLRFQQEARTIANLEHPHILPVYDAGQHDGIPYLAMRLLEAGTLTQRIESAPLTPSEIDHIFSQLADALAYAHERGVIHRDIKPSNVMLDSQGRVFLSDFGIAKLVEGAVKVTVSGTITGTPAYMSPEQARGEVIDPRSDVYALGIVLYEMVTGRVPFDAETPLAVILKIVQDPLPLPSTFKPSLAPELEAVLLKALAKDRTERYASCREFLSAWKVALKDADTVRAQPAATSNVSAPVRPVSEPTYPRTPAAQPKKGNSVWIVGGIAALIGLCLCTLIGLGGVSLLPLLFGGGAGTQVAGSTGTPGSGGDPVATPTTGEAIVDSFEFDFDTRIERDQPGPGAGYIESPTAIDEYTFTAEPGQRVYFQVIDQPGGDLISLALFDENDFEVFNTCLACGDKGVVVLDRGGQYRMVVGGPTTGQGTYSLRLWLLEPPEEFEAAIGDTLSSETLGEGAGFIALPGDKDIYEFTAEPGDVIYVQVTEPPTTTDIINLELYDEIDSLVFNKCLQCGDQGIVNLDRGGTYQLIVGNKTGPAVGSYALKLWDVPAPDETAVTPDAIIEGNIETPGASDIFTFTANAGQTLELVLVEPTTSFETLRLRVFDSNGLQVLDSCLRCTLPPLALTSDGQYRLLVGTENQPVTGTYQLQINLR